MAAVQRQIPPPRLEFEADIPSISFYLFKTTFISYMENQNISNENAFILLRDSIPTGPLRVVISTSRTFQDALELLSKQFKPPQDEIPILKSKIINRGVLSPDYTYDTILDKRGVVSPILVQNRRMWVCEDLNCHVKQGIIVQGRIS